MPPTPTPLGKLSSISCMSMLPTSGSNITPPGAGVPGSIGSPKSPPSIGMYGAVGCCTTGGGARKLLNVCFCMSINLCISC